MIQAWRNKSLSIYLLIRSIMVFPKERIDKRRIGNHLSPGVQRVNAVLRHCRQRAAQKQRRKDQCFHHGLSE